MFSIIPDEGCDQPLLGWASEKKMQCPTCGKRVPKGQAVCPYCGALVESAALIPFGQEDPFRMEPQTPQVRGVSPEGTAEEERKLEELDESPPVPSPPSSEHPRPRPPSWIRLLIPLIFILIPVLNILWDSSFRLGSVQPPVFRQALFCEGIRNGRPVNPKEVFSLREDRQVVLYSLWSGARGSHAYLLRWYSPDGKVQPVSTPLTRYQPGQDEFQAYTILPLRPGMALGKWRVEVLLDDRIQAQLSFELRE
ncbi:MAG: hypothetical protein HYS38_01540 [Acidobacteria bacterium]|nr:hypothetical protein [Acidobacteriota bacterium]